MAAADIHHRTADFRALYSRVLADTQTFIGTKNDVVMFASSGTGAMEAAVSNLTSPGDKVLVVTAGKFGERWKSLASAYGCNVEVVFAEYGKTVEPDAVKAKLTPDVRVVYMQATESSTGVRHDVQGIAALLKGTDTLLVVDAITGLGTTHFDVDGWGIDVIIGGSQKAVMIPPGLAYCAVSERAWKRMETTKNPRFYFDLRKERKNAAKGESSYTPAIALIAALASAFDFIRNMGKGDLAAGRVALVDNAEMCAEMMREAALALKLQLFAPDAPSAAVTSILPPAGVDSGRIVKGFRDEFGAVISNGQGEMKGQIFRMAHLGYFDYMDTIATVGALEQVLAIISLPKHVEFGQGLKAAQEVFARVAGSARNAKAVVSG
jgi:aspartate aminotransferase-like enzyme